MASTVNVKITALFNGENISGDAAISRHHITTLKGLEKVLLQHRPKCQGWGFRLQMTPEAFAAVGGYEAQNGQTYVPLYSITRHGNPLACYLATAEEVANA